MSGMFGQVLDGDFVKRGQGMILPDHTDAFAGRETLDIDARTDLAFHPQETEIDHPFADELVDGGRRFKKVSIRTPEKSLT